MRHGFIKTAAVTPKVQVADPEANAQEIIRLAAEAAGNGAKLIVFPELCITGYTCGDLFLQELLLKRAKEELFRIIRETAQLDALIFAGLPWEKDGKLYNVAAAFQGGRLLGLVPKTCLPNYGEFYELRHFARGNKEADDVWVDLGDGEGDYIPFGTKLLFTCESLPGLAVAAEICEDVWVPDPPSIRHALAGATVIVNCSASDETTGKDGYREALISGQSARLVCGYIYANAGEGESSQDLVFGGHNLIAENGKILSRSARFKNETIYADLDIERIVGERRRMTTFFSKSDEVYTEIGFRLKREDTRLERLIDPAPFVPDDSQDRQRRCEEIFAIQYMGLKKRLEHTHCRTAVVGISGGLDSTLALLVTVRAFDSLGLPREGILGVTMPCFGTTDRTYHNACDLVKRLGATLREVDIKEAVSTHFRDIGHDPERHDVTYENSQARERTQVLMDLANQSGGLVIGTGDMSELALGWATYNGDHMSMYGVNAGVPKTLVRHLVRYCADTYGDKELAAVLLDVLDTPVSPELLPPKDGVIAQKTEDLVGPYELHDFYLYYVLRFGFSPSKIYRLARRAFEGVYGDETILKWLKTFYRRFFSQQFKRSCLPDGPKVGSVAVSPRGDLRMPSDASASIWLKELENL
ncbi:NAD(+) synthase [Lachnoclostridium sp. An131]|uniref:NAD(+) synthase n=1 Tax=Lachnoclostridium sp. An131 TaxID=1965555 RepID=UPI000B391019|nr:NAD(+) synthase [Lachnoclostridium sp. An131]OUQ23595.1 NAD(+) synthase [Lachnoclostridium sp. An131]